MNDRRWCRECDAWIVCNGPGDDGAHEPCPGRPSRCPATPDGLWCDCEPDDPNCNYDEAAGLNRDPNAETLDEFDRYIRSGGTVSGWDMGGRP